MRYHGLRYSGPRMRTSLLAVAILALLPPVMLDAGPLSGQAPSENGAQSQDSQSETAVPLLRITTREVLIDLIALDRHNQPVLDLKPDELQVTEATESESTNKRERSRNPPTDPGIAARISSLPVFDPKQTAGQARTGLRIQASCLERSTVHYLLAFHPGLSGSAGYHRIAIATSRAGTRLLYRHHYDVGASAPLPDTQTLQQ